MGRSRADRQSRNSEKSSSPMLWGTVALGLTVEGNLRGVSKVPFYLMSQLQGTSNSALWLPTITMLPNKANAL